MKLQLLPKKVLARRLFLSFIAVLALFISFVCYLNLTAKTPDHYRLGVSFSVKYTTELGTDWQASLIALSEDLGIKHFRLMSYWDLHEPAHNQYDFKSLDWQFEQVAKTGGSVSLAIGARQPRWPECHEPGWATELDETAWEQELLEYIEVVVKRYRNHPALASWQLENEALNRSFGHCENYDRERLKKEFALVKSLDPNRPIIMSQSNQYGIPLGKPLADAYGLSVYKVFYDKSLFNRYIIQPSPAWNRRFIAEVIERYLHRDVIIHELQAEPWGPKATAQMSPAEQAISMNPEQLTSNVEYAKTLKIQDIYLWGGEWWYWLKVNHKDPSLWESAREVYN